MKFKSFFLALLLLATGSSLFGQQQVQPVNGVLTLNLAPGVNSFKVILGANVTSVVFTNPTPGTTATVIFTENATGGFTVAFGAEVQIHGSEPTAVPAGAPPTPTLFHLSHEWCCIDRLSLTALIGNLGTGTGQAGLRHFGGSLYGRKKTVPNFVPVSITKP